MPALIPDSFRSMIAGRPADAVGAVTGDAWLAALPALVDERLSAWDLAVDGAARHGECALALPVRRAEGAAAVLKLTWPHAEAVHEHLALRAWDGRGAVRLLAAHPADGVLLLERLDPDRDLHALSIIDACEQIGALMRRLDRPAPARIDVLDDQVPRWRGKLARQVDGVPRRLVQQAAAHLTDLMADDDLGDGVTGRDRLVHTDLHYANVLAPLPGSGRGDWLAIDPKPLSAEWAFAVAPAIWNRAEEAARAHSLAVHVRLRADLIADAAGLDEDRVRMWTFVRLILNAVDAADVGSSAGEFRGRMIALAKAFATP